MLNKKGQAAMEFMMTYGWALLVVLAAIGAMSYFGVFDFSSVLPDRCSFPPGMDCTGKAALDTTTDTITFVVINSIGNSINLTGGSVTSDECTGGSLSFLAGTGSGTFTTNEKISNNEKATIKVNCTALPEGRTKADVTINYIDSNTGLSLKAQGKIRSKAI